MFRADVRHHTMQAKIVNEFHLQSEGRHTVTIPCEDISFLISNLPFDISIVCDL